MTSILAPQPISLNRQEGLGATTWLDGAQGIVELNWRAGLLEQLRSYVGSTYISRSGKGSDVGGVLFGNRNGESVQVLSWRPIQRGKDATSHFYLDSKEEQSLVKLLDSAKSDATLGSMEVLGWFRSRTKGEPRLDDHDIRFHEKFFPDAAQFALVIRPSHQRPAEASLYVRNDSNQFEPANPSAKLTLQPGPVSVETSSSAAVSIPGILLDEIPETPRKRFPWLKAIGVFAVAALLAVAAVVALQWNNQRVESAATTPALGFEVTFDGTDLKAQWNPASQTILKAATAQLLLGGERLQLSQSELAQGFLRVPMKSDLSGDTEISFKVGNAEEVAQLIFAAR